MSISLRFPMPVNVAPDACFELFPTGDYDAYENVEYHIGSPAVRFVVKRAVVEAQPRSFLALQLAHRLTMGGNKDIAEKQDDNTTVILKEHDPKLFPLVFGYMNQAFTNPSTANIPATGLSKAEVDAVRELTKGFLAIDDLSSLLFKAKSALPSIDGIRLQVKGRLDARHGKRLHATVSPDGVITCTAEGQDISITINLRDVPTEAPWPKSLVGDKVLQLLQDGRNAARAKGPSSPPAFGDILPPVPETDDELVPYPYTDIDHQTNFFIPAAAIVCKLHDDTLAVCEGVYRCEEDHLRIDAVDQDKYHWLWLEVDAM